MASKEWLKYDNARRKHEAKYYRSTQIALNKITKQFVESLKLGVFPNADDDSLYDMEAFNKNLEKMWTETAWAEYKKEYESFMNPTKSVWDTIKSSYLDTVINYLKTKTDESGIMNYTRSLSNKILSQIAKEGLSIENAANRYQTLMNVYNRVRAVTIVRTEIGQAFNISRADAADATGLKLEKRWIRAYDDRTRDTHKDVTTDYIPKEDYFKVGDDSMLQPSDPDGSAENIINCRCTVGYRRVKQNRVE